VWLAQTIQHVLRGQTYPEVRAVAAGWSSAKELHLSIYLDRDPTEFDREWIDIVLTEILSCTSSNDDITAISDELVFSLAPMNELDSMSGFLYQRFEGRHAAD
ncbi:colicin, partial [Salmonella enterica subsp. enterica serovar Enteritidis]|nr:colicin [Salmonella enterica subsp. enterica serovar Enteritidis]